MNAIRTRIVPGLVPIQYAKCRLIVAQQCALATRLVSVVLFNFFAPFSLIFFYFFFPIFLILLLFKKYDYSLIGSRKIVGCNIFAIKSSRWFITADKSTVNLES